MGSIENRDQFKQVSSSECSSSTASSSPISKTNQNLKALKKTESPRPAQSEKTVSTMLHTLAKVGKAVTTEVGNAVSAALTQEETTHLPAIQLGSGKTEKFFNAMLRFLVDYESSAQDMEKIYERVENGLKFISISDQDEVDEIRDDMKRALDDFKEADQYKDKDIRREQTNAARERFETAFVKMRFELFTNRDPRLETALEGYALLPHMLIKNK